MADGNYALDSPMLTMRAEPWYRRLLRRRLYLVDAPRWTPEEIVELALIEAFAPSDYANEWRDRFASGGGLMQQADDIAVDGEVFLVFWLDSHARPGLPEHLSDRKGGRKRRRRSPRHVMLPAPWPWR